MNITERLNSVKAKSNYNAITIKEDYNSLMFFERNIEAETHICNFLAQNRNFLLICNSGCDKNLVCNYIKNFMNFNQSTETIDNPDNIKYSNASTIIIPSTDFVGIVNIFKYTMIYSKTYICATNLNNHKNILQTIKTLIGLEYPNLNENNTDHLIGSSEAIIVFICQNEDGLYKISNIDEIKYQQNIVSLDCIYSENQKKEIKTGKIETAPQKTENSKNMKELTVNYTEENTTDDINRKKIINKCNLLKEKFKKHKKNLT